MVRTLLFSAKHSNTGLIHIGNRTMAASGGNGTAITLPVPTVNSIPFIEFTSDSDNNNIPVGNFRVDGSVNEDIVRVSVLVA